MANRPKYGSTKDFMASFADESAGKISPPISKQPSAPPQPHEGIPSTRSDSPLKNVILCLVCLIWYSDHAFLFSSQTRVIFDRRSARALLKGMTDRLECLLHQPSILRLTIQETTLRSAHTSWLVVNFAQKPYQNLRRSTPKDICFIVRQNTRFFFFVFFLSLRIYNLSSYRIMFPLLDLQVGSRSRQMEVASWSVLLSLPLQQSLAQ